TRRRRTGGRDGAVQTLPGNAPRGDQRGRDLRWCTPAALALGGDQGGTPAPCVLNCAVGLRLPDSGGIGGALLSLSVCAASLERDSHLVRISPLSRGDGDNRRLGCE